MANGKARSSSPVAAGDQYSMVCREECVVPVSAVEVLVDPQVIEVVVPCPQPEPPEEAGPPRPQHAAVAPGARLLRKLHEVLWPKANINRLVCYQASILVLTYFTYLCYHMTRKPISVVKNVLHQNCSQFTPPPDVDPSKNTTWCDWAPFDGTEEETNALFGTLDSAFLFAYAISMFFSGFVAERVNLRYFLSIGMVLSGFFTYLFGIAKTYNIHSITYFMFVQGLAGICQTTGWPGVVTVVGKWFGKDKRGFIFGVWNSHTSIGNILGTLIASAYVETNWALSFIVPGIIMGAFGIVLFLFLVEDPANVRLMLPDSSNGSINTSKRDLYKRMEGGSGHLSDDQENQVSDEDNSNSQIVINGEQDNSACHRSHRTPSSSYAAEQPSISRQTTSPTEITTLLTGATTSSAESAKAVGFIGALKIPGVIEFSLCLFFAKLVSYTFLYWLPLYIRSSTDLGAKQSADLSTVFDIGGIIGGILAGILCDWTGMSATTCALMLLIAGPMMMVYQWFGTYNIIMNVVLLLIVGLLVNGPYALITTAVSAELGTHSSLEGNSKALATVTAIIDGTGSVGAAIGPLLAALVSSQGWAKVFYMLIACDIIAFVLLIRMMKHELSRFWQHHRAGPIE